MRISDWSSDVCSSDLLHQCTFWKAGRLTLKKLLQREKMGFKADTTFLDPLMSVDPPPRHPWLTAPADALIGDRERIVDLAGTQVFGAIAFRGISDESSVGKECVSNCRSRGTPQNK